MRFYGTLGPACAGADCLAAMIEKGMTGIRLNLSHRGLKQAEAELEALALARQRCGADVDLLIDMHGPELRVGALAEPLPLPEGRRAALDALRLPEALRARLLPGQELLLDDGRLRLRVETGGEALVLRGGVLHSRKSVAAPGIALELPPITEEDRENIALASSCGVTELMQPFVRSRADLDALRSALDAAGAAHVRLLAKIENREGLERLPELLPGADEMVIARGDLGNAMPLWELPEAQKRIARLCRREGRPFMVVTQMLASMEERPVPTRAEVSDVFNAVLDGAASVMLTGETAVGRYPVEAMDYLVRTARQAERYLAEG